MTSLHALFDRATRPTERDLRLWVYAAVSALLPYAAAGMLVLLGQQP